MFEIQQSIQYIVHNVQCVLTTNKVADVGEVCLTFAYSGYCLYYL